MSITAQCLHGLTPVWRDPSVLPLEATKEFPVSLVCNQTKLLWWLQIAAAVQIERQRKKLVIFARKAAVMRTDDFDYNLPEERIAQAPAEPRLL